MKNKQLTLPFLFSHTALQKCFRMLSNIFHFLYFDLPSTASLLITHDSPLRALQIDFTCLASPWSTLRRIQTFSISTTSDWSISNAKNACDKLTVSPWGHHLYHIRRLWSDVGFVICLMRDNVFLDFTTWKSFCFYGALADSLKIPSKLMLLGKHAD